MIAPCQNLFVEGGAGRRAFLRAGLVDRLLIYRPSSSAAGGPASAISAFPLWRCP
jgi:riboflavin biosynthesis pyrimidine reductase